MCKITEQVHDLNFLKLYTKVTFLAHRVMGNVLTVVHTHFGFALTTKHLFFIIAWYMVMFHSIGPLPLLQSLRYKFLTIEMHNFKARLL